MTNKENEIIELYNNVLNGIEIDKLINDMSILLERSIVLCDSSFRIITYSTDFPVTDSIWEKNVLRGFCSYEFIMEIKKLVPNLFQVHTTDPFLVHCDASQEQKLVCPVIYNNQMIAYLLLLDNQKGIPDYARTCIQNFSHMVTFSLKQLPNFHYLLGDMMDNILDEFMETGDIKTARGRIEAAGVSIPSSFYCLTCFPIENTQMNQKYVKRSLRQLFNGCIISVYEDSIICLIPKNLLIIEDLENNTNLKKGIRCIGVSPCLTDLEDVRRGYDLAKRTCELYDLLHSKKQSLNEPCFVREYKDYKFHNLLFSCHDKRVLKDNVHPSLEILLRYDSKNNTNLFETLRSYLEHNLSIADTATSMYIHRNTISYRLSRITELVHLDLNNHQTRFELECSFRIYDLLMV